MTPGSGPARRDELCPENKPIDKLKKRALERTRPPAGGLPEGGGGERPSRRRSRAAPTIRNHHRAAPAIQRRRPGDVPRRAGGAQ